MLEAMRRILGPHVEQRGSNITQERLRFDFSHPDKLTPEQIKQIEDLANEQIARNLDVHYEEMTVPEAKAIGATGVFEHKYGDKVKVYFIGDFSKEICGGPHVENTKGMGKLKITKEEASSAGVRRVKAILEETAN
jgi:alanyl-tRNA synthetase